jgi:hypothetical protein
MRKLGLYFCKTEYVCRKDNAINVCNIITGVLQNSLDHEKSRLYKTTSRCHNDPAQLILNHYLLLIIVQTIFEFCDLY